MMRRFRSEQHLLLVKHSLLHLVLFLVFSLSHNTLTQLVTVTRIRECEKNLRHRFVRQRNCFLPRRISLSLFLVPGAKAAVKLSQYEYGKRYGVLDGEMR